MRRYWTIEIGLVLGFVGIQFMRLYAAWFRCFIHEDPTACALFEGGESCGICNDPDWAVLESRNF